MAVVTGGCHTESGVYGSGNGRAHSYASGCSIIMSMVVFTFIYGRG